MKPIGLLSNEHFLEGSARTEIYQSDPHSCLLSRIGRFEMCVWSSDGIRHSINLDRARVPLHTKQSCYMQTTTSTQSLIDMTASHRPRNLLQDIGIISDSHTIFS
jgi:hypothetical protein